MEPQTLNTESTTVYRTQTKISGVTAWSMESPVLYTMDAKLVLEGQVIDDWIDRVGFRTVEIRKNQILLNGRAIRVKGFAAMRIIRSTAVRCRRKQSLMI